MMSGLDSSTPSSAASSSPKESPKKWILENVISLGLSLFIILMIRSSIIEAFKIPTGSMIPTLFIGDHIFVNKFSYGLKIPFSDNLTDHPIYVIQRDPPKRGDIVVFKFPKDEDLYFIKRVIGVPGDTVEIKNKVLYINQKPIARDQVTGAEIDRLFQSLGNPHYNSSNLDYYVEHLDGVDHPIFIDKTNYISESFGPITVPPDNLFVMGDNRDLSNDSRFWGFVPLKNVKGKALFIWASHSIGWNEFTFRPERIGKVLH
ncbi:MAG: signal peptidase I [Bdellovibrionia bacterium]